MTTKYLLRAILILILSAPALSAQASETAAGARAIGMANASAALSDDVFGYFNNPAGAAYVRQGQAGFEYSKLWVGLKDGSDLSNSIFSVSLPITIAETKKEQSAKTSQGKDGILGEEVSKSTDTAATLYKTTLKNYGTISFGTKLLQLSGAYQQSAHHLSYAKRFGKRAALGMSLKLLTDTYTMDSYLALSPVFGYGSKNSISALSADVGAIYNIMPRINLGLCISDINQPSLALDSNEQINSTYRLGVAYKQQSLNWAADAISKGGNIYGAAGFEKWFYKKAAIRAGLTLGGRNYAAASCGASFDLREIRIDYAFWMPFASVRDSYGSHIMSFTYRFGKPAKDDMEPGSLELYYSELQDENINLKDTLAQTEAEKRKLEEVLIEEATMRIRERIKNAKIQTREEKVTVKTPEIAQPKEKKNTHYTVKAGDTLNTIAEQLFGDSKYWNDIYQLNKNSVGRGGAVKEGQVLVLPQQSVVSVEPQSRSSRFESQAAAEVKIENPRFSLPAKIESAPAPVVSQVLVPVPVEVKTVEPARETELNVSEAKPAAAAAPVEKKSVGVEAKAKSNLLPAKHIVQQGENFKSIAQKYYKDASKWKDIYIANKAKAPGGQIIPGQEITIPALK